MTEVSLDTGGMLDDSAAIAERVVRTREALGLTQAELCRAIVVQPNRWNQYESGERRITLDVAAKLVAKYRITLDWIYLGDQSGLPGRVLERLTEPAE